VPIPTQKRQHRAEPLLVCVPAPKTFQLSTSSTTVSQHHPYGGITRSAGNGVCRLEEVSRWCCKDLGETQAQELKIGLWEKVERGKSR